MLRLFPESAAEADGELTIGGMPASELAEAFGTPLVVYCERTLVAQARAYTQAAPEALVAYGTKAFPNLAIMRLFAGLGLGADVSSLGELSLALRAGIPGDRLVQHGNNKSDRELTAGAEAGALLVLDALDEVERAAGAGASRVLVRVTPGIEAETHESIRTGHRGSKFGLPPDDTLEALRHARDLGLDAQGLHVHVGSQLLDLRALVMTVDWLAAFTHRCRSELGWTPRIVDLGGGLGVRIAGDEQPPSVAEWVGALRSELERAWDDQGLPPAQLVLEPGRSLVGRAGATLYRVGVVKPVTASTTYVGIDGGMSDNPRPQLYGARHTATLANRFAEEPSGTYGIAGVHCESGDVLIESVPLPRPRRGDLLAVPATGAYTLALSSNYNGVPRPAAVLVRDGEARVIRRRETLEDLLHYEAES